MEKLDRITIDPRVMGGKPCIRGIRITVGTIVGLLAAGETIPNILRAYSFLEEEDIHQALAYAAWRASEREVEIGPLPEEALESEPTVIEPAPAKSDSLR